MHTLTALLLAVAAATPTPTPTPVAKAGTGQTTLVAAPAPTPMPTPIPTADTGQTRTLADVARERKLGKKGVQGGTLSVAGAPVSQAAQASIAASGSATLAADAFQAAWIKRNADVRGELAEAQDALGQAEAALPPAVTFYGRGSEAAQALANQIRGAALAPYRARVLAAQATVDGLREEARKAGAQPGWVR